MKWSRRTRALIGKGDPVRLLQDISDGVYVLGHAGDIVYVVDVMSARLIVSDQDGGDAFPVWLDEITTLALEVA